MKIKNIHSFLKNNIFAAVAYFTTLYYLEIISLMFTMALLFGKVVSVTGGLALSAILTLHIILLNSGKNASRIIQLVIMDLHAAVSVSSLASFWLLDSQTNTLNVVQLSVRAFILLIEIPLIIALTDVMIIGRFKKESAA